MSGSVSSEASARSLWLREPTIFVLAFISTNTRLFETPETRHQGFAVLAQRLEAVYPHHLGYTPEKVSSKVRDIWRRSHGEADIEELFRYGVHKATLPYLELYSFVTYEEIRHQIDVLQREQDILKPSSVATRSSIGKSKYELRRPRLSTKDVYKCICPFDTADGNRAVQCDQCQTWQHMYCYYEPETHLCEACANLHVNASNIHSVSEEIDQLSVVSEDAQSKLSREDLLEKIKKLQSQNHQLAVSQESNRRQIRSFKLSLEAERSLGTFTTFNNSDIPGRKLDLLTNREIEEAVSRINALARKYLGSKQLHYKEIQLASVSRSHDLSDELFLTWNSYLQRRPKSSRKDVKHRLSKTIAASFDILQALVWTAIRDWVFDSDVFSLEALGQPFWLQLSRCIFDRDSAEALRNLYLASWYSLTSTDNPDFQDLLSNKAADMGRRLSNMVSSLETRCNNDVQNVDDSTAQDPVRNSVLFEELIMTALKLKSRLPFKSSRVEFYLPSPGDTFDEILMEGPTPLLLNNAERVLLAISPAILLYDSSTGAHVREKTHHPSSILKNMTTGTMDRKQATIVCTASVICEKA